MPRAIVIAADNRTVRLAPESVSAIVCDPPMGKRYLGLAWDAPRAEAFADEVAASLRPAVAALRAGHWAAVWGHPSTSHWTALGCARAGLEVVHKVVHANAENRAPSPDLLAPGHEEWVLCRKPGPPVSLSLALWREAAGARHPRTFILSPTMSAAFDELVGDRRVGAWSGKRNAGKHKRHGRNLGAMQAAPRAEGVTTASSFFAPSAESLLVVYAPRARRRHRELGPGGPETEHAAPKSTTLMLPIVDLVTGCAAPGPVLDCYAGTGSTGEAALLLGRDFIGIENDPAAVRDMRIRLRPWLTCGPWWPPHTLLPREPVRGEPARKDMV